MMTHKHFLVLLAGSLIFLAVFLWGKAPMPASNVQGALRVDFHIILKTVGETCKQAGGQVHAYGLMRHPFHLVVETPNANLVEGMRGLLST